MKGNVIETVMGAVVLVVAALFLFFAYNTSQLRSVKGYELTANFEHIDGIRDGSDVRVSGIKVGSVLGTTLDPKTFLATVTMSVEPSVTLPDDTVAEIVSSGLLGDKYLSLVPGGSDKDYTSGLRIGWTSGTDQVPEFAKQIAAAIWGDGVTRIGFDLSQQIFTPTATHRVHPDPTDRPYAAYLAGTFSLVQDKDDSRSVLAMSIGTIGPSALESVTRSWTPETRTFEPARAVTFPR